MTVGGHLLDQIMGPVTPHHSPSQDIYSFQLWQSHVVLYIWGFLVNRIFSILLYFLWCFIVSYVLVSSWHVMFFIHTIGHGTFFSIVTVYRFKRVNLLNPEVINGIFKVVGTPFLPLEIGVILCFPPLPEERPQMETTWARNCRNDKVDLMNNGFVWVMWIPISIH